MSRQGKQVHGQMHAWVGSLVGRLWAGRYAGKEQDSLQTGDVSVTSREAGVVHLCPAS